ncbi:hypothetical protein F4778DRAFT_443544 [Xylariomycetidae sp. FL2044]|nr:hypothetical protein F4778DRAFT_443544 [Xylariomycetidae sp. FL2044]
MAEVQARSQAPSSRGRGGGRGGRGGFAGRGSTNRRTNGTASSAVDSFDDDGDVSLLRKQYGTSLDTIKGIFPDWSDADILYALKETDGDVEVAATRIADGTISQWGEVSKPKKTAPRPKAKESAHAAGPTDSSGSSRPARGGRADGGRGGRGRGSERARGGAGRGRGASHVATNGHRAESQQLSVPTDESTNWGDATTTEDTNQNDWKSTWDTTDSTETAPAPTSTITATDTPTIKSTVIPKGTAKTWASMLRQSTAPKPAPKPTEVPTPKPAEALEPLPPAELAAPVADIPEPETEIEEAPKETVAPPEPAETSNVVVPEVALPPPEDDLTRVNLELLPDDSHALESATVASTAADSWDPRQIPASAAVTPLSASQAQHQAALPTTSGYAATALKATERPAARMPSYQRRLLEQEEAVRMPGNREVDRAAVQFGAFSLNGIEDDIDGDREDPETRTQPPAESPVAVPRASLPPVTQPAAIPESFPAAQKPAASLPQAPGSSGIATHHPVPAHRPTDINVTAPSAAPTGPAVTSARMSQYPQAQKPTNFDVAPQAPAGQQYARFGQSAPQEPAGFSHKPYDNFSHQVATTSAGSFDNFPAPTTQGPGSIGAFSSAPTDYSSYYTADSHGRNSYNNFYSQQYNQPHGGQGQSEAPTAPSAQNRGFAGYGAQQSENLAQYPQSGAQQSRYGAAGSGDAHNSGHNTPNPVGQPPSSSAQGNQPQSNLHQQQHATPNQYPYSHPYYQNPYYNQYTGQVGNYNQGGYGGGPYGKGGFYAQPHGYGMSPQNPYEQHGSSPAASAFGQPSLGGRDSGLGSGIDNYGRAGSAQSGAPGLGGGFGGMHESFGRSSAYSSQNNQGFNAPNAPSSNTGAGGDDLKPYGDSKAAAGPSPSLGNNARPGSATNTTPAGSGLPPPQSAQQGMGGYGGYPSHLSHGLHGNQTGGNGFGLGASGGQGHNNGPYSSYGGNQGFGGYGSYSRQGQGGWGGNYH